jgi:hypothetical protein
MKRNNAPRNQNQTLSGFDGTYNNNNRYKPKNIEPAPSSSVKRVNLGGANENENEQNSFSPGSRARDGQRQQQQQLQQLQQQDYNSSGGQQQYQNQKYPSLRKEGGSLQENQNRANGVSAYNKNSIRNIVSRGREGIFFDEGEGGSGNGMESSPDNTEGDKNKGGNHHLSRRQGGQRRRHRQQPMMLGNMNMVIIY